MKTVGSLFTGIAGLDLGLERAGWTVIWQAETNPYACKVLKKHYPNVPNLGDVTQIDWDNVRRPDLVCGGFPCQPVSHAGTRKGDTDDRWLWPEVERCLRLVRPEWVLLENVPGLLTLGFGQVAADLADLGYDLRWDCIPAAAVGAPHLRYRIFVVAHTDRDSQPSQPVDAGPRPRQLVSDTNSPGRVATRADIKSGWAPSPVSQLSEDVADTERVGLEEQGHLGISPRWQPSDPVADGGWWEFEPDVGRVAHGIPHRVDRLRCLGNAVVPQVAELIARMWLP